MLPGPGEFVMLRVDSSFFHQILHILPHYYSNMPHQRFNSQTPTPLGGNDEDLARTPSLEREAAEWDRQQRELEQEHEDRTYLSSLF